jgi:hypothetical protein
MNPNCLDFWRALLLGKGFKEPYYTYSRQKGYFVFVLGKIRYGDKCEVAVCEDDLIRRAIPKISISYKSGVDQTVCVWAEKDMESIECIIDALLDPVQIPLCIGITWAAPLVEKLSYLEAA